MTAFWESLTAMEKFYGACALCGGILFLIRTILMFMGQGGDTDLDGDIGDVHGDADAGFKIISLQSLTAFFMMFGLVALALSRQLGFAHGWSVLGGLLAGLFTVWVIGRIFLGMKKLQADGTMRIANAVGQEGEIYLPVAPGKTGQARVNVQGQLRVLDAVTAGTDALKTGDRVRVVSITGGNTLLVEKI